MTVRRSSRAARVLALAAVGLLLALATGLWRWPVGPPLLEVTAPPPDAIVGIEALEVVVHFPRDGWVRHETFRVRLNGADLTDSFETARNGAYGRLTRVVDGENVLEVGVFGRAWWPGERLVEHTRVVPFRVQRPVDRYWG